MSLLNLPISDTQTVLLADCTADPANARQHGEQNMQAIADSLKTFGQVEPLVVQEKTGRVIGGNGRLEAMRKLGWKHVKVVKVDLDNTQATALGIALNRTGELATWDMPNLEKLLFSLKSDDFNLDSLGFTGDELGRMLADDMDLSQMNRPGQNPPHLGESVQSDDNSDGDGPAHPRAGQDISTSHVRLVQLFFNQEANDEFYQLADKAQVKLEAANLSETVLKALRQTLGEG